MATNSKAVLSLSEAAKVSGMNRNYLLKCIHEETLKAERVAMPYGTQTMWTVSKEALEAFLSRPRSLTARADGKNKHIVYCTRADAVELAKDPRYEVFQAPTHQHTEKRQIK